MLGRSNTLARVDILFVAAEHCADAMLIDHLRVLSTQGSLSRIVVDECHLVLTWSEFRPAMLDVHRIRQQPVPLLLLSATVPPQMESRLKIAFASDFKTLRSETTSRPNLKYSVNLVKDTDELYKLLGQKVKDNCDQNCEGIVYCQTIRECKLVKEHLEEVTGKAIGCYYSTMEAVQKREVQSSFMSSEQGSLQVVVATSAFGTGIDKPNVAFVYHVGITDSIIEYAQQSGRAGRLESLVPVADCSMFTTSQEQTSLLKFRERGSTVVSKEQVVKDIKEVMEYTKVQLQIL